MKNSDELDFNLLWKIAEHQCDAVACSAWGEEEYGVHFPNSESLLKFAYIVAGRNNFLKMPDAELVTENCETRMKNLFIASLEMNNSELRLMVGEMTAGELRTVRAVLNSLVCFVRREL